MKLFNLTKNKVIIENLKIAESYRERTKGLLGRTSIEENEGLLIKNCNWIHMFFMKFPIDAIFLRTQKTNLQNDGFQPAVNGCSPRLQSGVSEANSIYKVVKIRHNIKPWRLSSPILCADSVLEIKSETAKNIVSIGDELKIMEEV